MKRIIFKVLIITFIGYLNLMMVISPNIDPMIEPSHPQAEAELSTIVAFPIFCLFAYRFWKGLKGWPFLLLLNIIVIVICIILIAPEPGG